MNQSKIDLKRADLILNSMTPKDYETIQRENQKARDDHKVFLEYYEKDSCFMCKQKLSHKNNDDPCIHWLLNLCDFKKKKDFKKVYRAFSYYQIATYLRWVANADVHLKNINNLTEDLKEGTLFSYTIVWKDIDWTFHCREGDFNGHKGVKSNFPHYHFQMRVNNNTIIKFNEFHIRFSDEDIFSIEMKRHRGDRYQRTFGPGGAGMKEALEIDPEYIIENTTSTGPDEYGAYHMQTFVDGGKEGIPEYALEEVFDEMRKTGKTGASLLKKRFPHLSMTTVISPPPDMPDIASRTPHNKGKKKSS